MAPALVRETCIARRMMKMPALTNDSSMVKHAPITFDWAKVGAPDYGVSPLIYSNPRDELLACRESAWLGSMLTTMSPVYDVSGPDAVKLFNAVTVNRDYAKMPVGGSRHSLLCNDRGQMLADGVTMRITEDTYRTYWLAPVISYYVDTMELDVKGEWVTDEYFFQIDGPKSLEILEKVSGTDIHDLKFAQHKTVQIAGHDVRVHRLGMSGALAYEFHGHMSEADDVWDAVVEAGREFGMRELGQMQYCLNHTQGGYPNQWIHFWYPRVTSGQELADYTAAAPGGWFYNNYQFAGSAGPDYENPIDTCFVTPFDVGWDYLINWNHEFIGKEALLDLAENPPRKCVTLEWDAEDVGKVFAAQLMGDPSLETDDITSDGDETFTAVRFSKVLDGDELVGVASGRIHDYYHRRMISLAFIRRDMAEEGRELEVVWGCPNVHQFKIRAKVARFPYYDEKFRNETFDVEEIPRLGC